MKIAPVKLVPTQLGAQPKQLAILAVLVVVLGVVFWINKTSSPEPQGATQPAAQTGGTQPVPSLPVVATAPRGPRAPMPAKRTNSRIGTGVNEDFRPTLKLKDDVDLNAIDPTIKLQLLAALHGVPNEGGSRSIFDFGAPPPPPPPKVAPIKPGPMLPQPEAKPVIAEAPKPPPPPPPPPIPLKFYGYSTVHGIKHACFLDGEEIFIVGENDLIRNRYKVIRIGVNSAVVEDTTNKNQQTLPLVEEMTG